MKTCRFCKLKPSSKNPKLNNLTSQLVQYHYHDEFFFYFAKPINEILLEIKSPHELLLKDHQFNFGARGKSNLKRLYSMDQIGPRLRRKAEEFESSRPEFNRNFMECRKVFLDRMYYRKKQRCNQRSEVKNVKLIEKFPLRTENILQNLEEEIHSDSFETRLYDIYNPEFSSFMDNKSFRFEGRREVELELKKLLDTRPLKIGSLEVSAISNKILSQGVSLISKKSQNLFENFQAISVPSTRNLDMDTIDNTISAGTRKNSKEKIFENLRKKNFMKKGKKKTSNNNNGERNSRTNKGKNKLKNVAKFFKRKSDMEYILVDSNYKINESKKKAKKRFKKKSMSLPKNHKQEKRREKNTKNEKQQNLTKKNFKKNLTKKRDTFYSELGQSSYQNVESSSRIAQMMMFNFETPINKNKERSLLTKSQSRRKRIYTTGGKMEKRVKNLNYSKEKNSKKKIPKFSTDNISTHFSSVTNPKKNYSANKKRKNFASVKLSKQKHVEQDTSSKINSRLIYSISPKKILTSNKIFFDQKQQKQKIVKKSKKSFMKKSIKSSIERNSGELAKFKSQFSEKKKLRSLKRTKNSEPSVLWDTKKDRFLKFKNSTRSEIQKKGFKNMIFKGVNFQNLMMKKSDNIEAIKKQLLTFNRKSNKINLEDLPFSPKLKLSSTTRTISSKRNKKSKGFKNLGCIKNIQKVKNFEKMKKMNIKKNKEFFEKKMKKGKKSKLRGSRSVKNLDANPKKRLFLNLNLDLMAYNPQKMDPRAQTTRVLKRGRSDSGKKKKKRSSRKMKQSFSTNKTRKGSTSFQKSGARSARNWNLGDAVRAKNELKRDFGYLN